MAHRGHSVEPAFNRGHGTVTSDGRCVRYSCDVQREQFGPRRVLGKDDPAKMTPQREKKQPKHVDSGHTV
jgi:hypothetical protein